MADQSGQTLLNYPLGEVTLVVNFPPEASVECLRHEFYSQIRKTYSQLIPPELRPGVPPALEPYRFDEEDGSSSVILGLNSLGYVTYKYGGYETFAGECVRLITTARNVFNIDRLTRVGLRYTNIIPFTRENARLPLEKFLNVSLKLPRDVHTNLDNLSIGFIVPLGDGVIDVRVEPRVKRDQSKEEALFLVLSYERTGDLKMESFAAYLESAHNDARRLFKALVKDSYRKSLKNKGNRQ